MRGSERAVVAERAAARVPWGMVFLVTMALGSNGLELALPAVAAAAVRSEWGLTPGEVGVFSLVQSVGALAGALGAGPLADRLGRRPTLVIALLASALPSGAGALSPGFLAFAALQLLAGVGAGILGPAASTLLNELAPAHRRGAVLAWVEVFWTAGWLLGALAGLLLLPLVGWRGVMLVGLLPAALVALGAGALPESPRHLLARGRVEEAARYLPPAELEAALATARRPVGASGSGSTGGGLAALWAPRQRRRTLAVWLLWLTMSSSFTAILWWLPTLVNLAGVPLEGSLAIFAVIGVAALPVCLLLVPLVDRLGRQRTLVPLLLLAALGAALMALAGDDGTAWLLTLGGIGVGVGLLAGWTVLLLYTAELYPTRLRATGAGWGAAIGRLGSLAAPVAVGGLLTLSGGASRPVFLLFAVVLLVGVIDVVLLGEETTGRTLEELHS